MLFAACQTPYTKFEVTNHRGEMIAEWIAEGLYWRTEDGMYRIKAVQRVSGPPYSQETHYPNGWQTLVSGPHIVHWRCGKPLWLYEMDHTEVHHRVDVYEK